MNIQNNKPVDNQEVAKLNLQRSAAADGKERTAPAEKAEPRQQAGQAAPADRINISSRTREIADLTAAIEKLPDVREDKVRQIREAIAAGTYSIDPRAIAEKILNEH